MAKPEPLDTETWQLVRLAAAIAKGYEPDLKERVAECRGAQVPVAWVEELLLQSLLMVGYPRTLVAFGIWRKLGHVAAPVSDSEADYRAVAEWTAHGEETCATVYGANYRRLRENVRELHPALDVWMITEGYGRTMSRPGLDLMRRELCTVAQTAMIDVPRQLHSHLRGALNAGATFEQVEAVLSVVNTLLSYDQWRGVKDLWQTVREGWEPVE
ncbi:MAG TPA: carboxymuconolactone decarboxylase family protein [Gemmatimonadales bacterium]|nr:carboxymuconolactone decarboxylase family protein [Gemmatimonadales bacterium]